MSVMSYVSGLGGVGGATTCEKPSRFGEKILTSLGEASNELLSINARLNKLESALLPPIPCSPSKGEDIKPPASLMDNIFYGITRLRESMNYTREIITRFENEL